RNRNAEYYDIPGSSRVNFWNTIANIINERFGGTYTGQQCNNRFKNLVRDHTRIYSVNMEKTPFDILHNENTSRHRNRTPPPTYEVPSILNNVTYESSSELINITSALNISASQNDSDFSMPDVVGGSQPLESINEEGD
ncbi:10079_t:CDS:2, partial [Diversispora eburnea]